MEGLCHIAPDCLTHGERAHFVAKFFIEPKCGCVEFPDVEANVGGTTRYCPAFHHSHERLANAAPALALGDTQRANSSKANRLQKRMRFVDHLDGSEADDHALTFCQKCSSVLALQTLESMRRVSLGVRWRGKDFRPGLMVQAVDFLAKRADDGEVFKRSATIDWLLLGHNV